MTDVLIVTMSAWPWQWSDHSVFNEPSLCDRDSDSVAVTTNVNVTAWLWPHDLNRNRDCVIITSWPLLRDRD